jgi:hypothetical protein
MIYTAIKCIKKAYNGFQKLTFLSINTVPIKETAKGKVHPGTGHEGPEGEQRYSSTLSLTSALNGDGRSTPRPGCFTLGKDSVPIV